MTVQKNIAEALNVWLVHDTWHTSHPHDENRFHSAVKAVNDTVGTDWTEHDFQEAVYASIGKDKQEAFDEYVSSFSSIALHLRDYAQLG